MRTIRLAAALAALLWMASPRAAAQVTAPALTDVQKLTLLTSVQKVEIAQLRAQSAQRDLEALLKSLQLPGYTLDLQTLTYVPAPPAPKGEPGRK